jgi:EKC/KEOPS complex subunit CGI121/TPRKB
LKIATTPDVTLESVNRHLSANIKGQEMDFEDATFHKMTDIDRLRKVYKLGPSTPKGRSSTTINGESGSTSGVASDETKHLEVQILGLIALRGAT